MTILATSSARRALPCSTLNSVTACPDTGLELRGEYVRVGFGHPENLRANNDTDPTDNVGKSMYGYSGEIAYHVPLGTI